MIDRQIQREVHTAFDRYPDLFRAASALTADLTPGRRPKVLSFGCSRGEEILSLRKYFPDAELFGCDINPDMLAIARETAGADATIFPSGPEEAARHGPFDAIFALSVLCVYGRDEKAIGKVFPLAAFESALGFLEGCLSPTGLLVLYNTSYRPTDTEAGRRLVPILHPAVAENGFVTRYDAAARLFARRGDPHRDAYELVRRPDDLADRDMTDVFFTRGDGASERLVFVQDVPASRVEAFPAGAGSEHTRTGKGRDLLPVTTARTRYYDEDGREYRVTRVTRPSLEHRGIYRHPPLVEVADGDGFAQAPGRLRRMRPDVEATTTFLNGATTGDA